MPNETRNNDDDNFRQSKARKQCDQMATLFIRYLAIYTN